MHKCHASRLEETWHHPYGVAWWWQHHAVGMFFIGMDWETSQNWGQDEQSKVQRDPWWKPASEHSGPQTGVKVHLPTGQWPQTHSDFGTSLWMSLSGTARVRTWTWSNISGETWKELCSDAPRPTRQSLRGSAEKNGETPQIQVCQAVSVISKKNQGSSRCQRFFNRVLSKGSEYLCKCDIELFMKTSFCFVIMWYCV